jgi:hypothetical protein
VTLRTLIRVFLFCVAAASIAVADAGAQQAMRRDDAQFVASSDASRCAYHASM